MELNQQHFLYPSTLYASEMPSIVTTILGSCVAVCLYDKVLKVGGINHYMLPLWNGEGLASPKYGNIAIEKLVERMGQMGSKRVNLIAKVFGGGEVIETNIKQFNIGERNIKIALEMLENYKIPIVAQSVGGKLGRKIQYSTATGEIKHKFIEKSLQP
jgi:chemotaxis protein CheD